LYGSMVKITSEYNIIAFGEPKRLNKNPSILAEITDFSTAITMSIDHHNDNKRLDDNG